MSERRRVYIHEGLSAERPVKAGTWSAPPAAAAFHVHDSLELLWNEQPLILHLGGERLALREPQFVIVPPLTPHIAESPGAAPLSGFYLSFLERALPGATDGPALRAGPLQPQDSERLQPLVLHLHERLLSEKSATPSGGDEAVARELQYIAAGIYHLLRDLGYVGTENISRNLDPVQRALEVLYARYDDSSLSISDLAAAADLSVAQFRRVFRSVTGQSPLAYLTRHRLEQARLLLAQDTFTVEAVARKVGFDSPGSFYKRFRQFFGQSPRGREGDGAIHEVARTWAPPNTYSPTTRGK